jgi:extracellular factor (EF) 3-hydroxypalmitic acid methyl ester biosynthesis protein
MDLASSTAVQGGNHHESFFGATGAGVAFRPPRVPAGEISPGLSCRFRRHDTALCAVPVVDVSSGGFAAKAPSAARLSPGDALEDLEIAAGDRALWTGAAVIVHATGDRFGARFTSGWADLAQLRLGSVIAQRLTENRAQRTRLPVAWRAAVADLLRLLEDARKELDAFERSGKYDCVPGKQFHREFDFFDSIRGGWVRAYFGALEDLDVLSRDLDEAARTLAREYATSTLMPVLAACPLLKRAYEKPLGYAGDFEMMELCYSQEPIGETLFGRFLFSATLQFGLARSTVGRAARLCEAVRDAVATAPARPGAGPTRILAVGAGPTMELRQWLSGLDRLDGPVELILLDQDRAAHEAAHRHLSRILLETHGGRLPVTVRCLHFSVLQLVIPRTAEEHAIVRSLEGLDLVYSSGLYDYLPDAVAVRLTRRLYSMLRPGGNLLVGNMAASNDTTWLMDYVLDWPLLYRVSEQMFHLGAGLDPAPASRRVTTDATGGCLFLEIVRAANPAAGSRGATP